MENLFTINLDVLSLVLYGRRSLEANCKNKMEDQRKEAYIPNLRTLENSWLQGTLINKSSSKSLHTYTETKLYPRADKFQSKTYHAILQQCRNTAISSKIQAAQSCGKPIDTSKLTTEHFIALQKEEI